MRHTVIGAGLLAAAWAVAVLCELMHVRTWNLVWPLLVVGVAAVIQMGVGLVQVTERRAGWYTFTGAALIVAAFTGAALLNVGGAYNTGWFWAMAGVGWPGLSTLCAGLDPVAVTSGRSCRHR